MYPRMFLISSLSVWRVKWHGMRFEGKLTLGDIRNAEVHDCLIDQTRMQLSSTEKQASKSESGDIFTANGVRCF